MRGAEVTGPRREWIDVDSPGPLTLLVGDRARSRALAVGADPLDTNCEWRRRTVFHRDGPPNDDRVGIGEGRGHERKRNCDQARRPVYAHGRFPASSYRKTRIGQYRLLTAYQPELRDLEAKPGDQLAGPRLSARAIERIHEAIAG